MPNSRSTLRRSSANRSPVLCAEPARLSTKRQIPLAAPPPKKKTKNASLDSLFPDRNPARSGLFRHSTPLLFGPKFFDDRLSSFQVNMSGRPSLSPTEIRGRSANDPLLVIERAQLVLNSIGVPDVCFEAESYLSDGMFPKAFAKLLRAVPNFEDPEKVEKILLIGVKRNLFGGIHNLTPRAFYDFLQFLKGPEGQDEIAKLHLTEKLAKRGGGHFDAKQMAWVSMFEAQRNDCLAEVNDVRREYDGRIVNSDMQLRKLQAERDAAVLAVGKKYKPYSEMKFLAGRQFNIACWDEYLNACRIERKIARKLETESLDEAVKLYSDIVRQKNILKELDHGSRREQLEKWIAMKIGKFADAEDTRQVKRFRGLLAAVDSTVLDAIPAGDVEEDYGSDSSEQVEGQEHGGVFEQVIPSSAERSFGAEATNVVEAQADVVPPDGDVDVKQGPDEEQQPIAGGRVGRRSRSSRHPSRA